jgi:DegV family protein with EDD domain
MVEIITDSAACLPPYALTDLDVVTVPLTLVVDGIVYYDGDLTSEELLDLAGGSGITTSAPSPGDFLKVVEDLEGEDDVLILTVSSKMSATYDAAVTAATYFAPHHVQVLDTGTAAGAQGLVVLEAARKAKNGATLEEIVARADRVASSVRLLAALENLEYLSRSGRVPAIAKWTGDSIGARPLFEFSRGRVRPRVPALSMRAATERIERMLIDDATGKQTCRVAAMHTGHSHLAGQLESRIAAQLPGAEIYLEPFSSVMVAHTGPGLIGAAWWTEEEGRRGWNE